MVYMNVGKISIFVALKFISKGIWDFENPK